MGSPSDSNVQNLLPVQAYFDVEGNFQTFIGQGKPFYATVYPYQSGLHITDSTIDSTTIGATTPSTGVFTDIVTTTGSVLTTPTIDVNIANKAYVDSVAQGLSFKAPATVASTENIPSLSGLLTIDGITLVAGNRVLVKNQDSAAENGIYVASSGAWSRSADANTWDEIVSAYLFIEEGDLWGGSSWVDTNQRGGTLGVTPVTFVQFSNNAIYTAGTGLTLVGFEFSITNIGTAGTYGSASAVPVLTTNAQGQVTSVTNTSISIAGTQITSGLISPTVGGTGVNNGSNTLTWNASYTLDQSVASGASPSFLGTNFALIPNAALINSSVTFNGVSVSLGSSGTITAVNPYALTLGTGLSGTSYDGSSAVTAAIANTGVTANSYSYANFTVNAQGQLTAASSNTTTGTGSIVLADSPTISGAWGSPDSITFDITPTVPTTQGSLYWDSADSAQTLSLVMEGGNAIQQIGEETYYRIKCSSAITEGQVVMFTGTVGASGGLTGAPATGLTASTASYIMGVATESGALNDWIYVTSFGLVRGIDTTGGAEAWVDGQILYYDPTVAGGLTKTLPTASNAKVQVCAVVHAASNGSLFIRPSFGGILGQYEGDVGFTSTSAYDLIQRNAGNTAWTNVAPSAISVGTATNLAGGSAGEVVYQVATNVTGFTAVGTTGQFLQSNGTGAPTWATPVSYATVTDDTTTNGTRYPLFANQTSGNLTTEYTSSTKLQFNPSTGDFTATSFSGAGTGLTGTASSLSIGGNAASATNIAGGAASQLVYQTGSGATGFISNGTAGQILQSNGASAPTWVTYGGGASIVDDTTTNATRYPLFAAATSGTLSTAYTSSTEFQYNPLTGILGVVGLTASGNIEFTGTGNRITGDFSTTTLANRVMFQSSTSSGNTRIGMMPNSSSGTSGPVMYSTNDPSNASYVDLRVSDGLEAALISSKNGTGVYLPLNFQTGGSERLRIDTSGNLLVNTTTVRTGFFNSTNPPLVQVEGTTFSTSSQSIVRNAADAAPSYLVLGKTRGTTVGGTTVVSTGDALGAISFQGADGTELVEGARIFAAVDNTPGANDMPTALVFNTTSDGASVSTERMRINSTGWVILPGSTASAIYPRLIVGEGTGGVALTVNDGYGNANIGFNHSGGTPDQSGSSARITSSVDSTTASLNFQLANNVTAGTPVSATTVGGFDTFFNFLFNSGYGSSAIAYGCRAWVNFNGTNGSIRASGNISSVSRTATGNYTVNFTNAMPNTNYAVTSGVGADISSGIQGAARTGSYGTSNFRLGVTSANGGAFVDDGQVCAAVFR